MSFLNCHFSLFVFIWWFIMIGCFELCGRLKSEPVYWKQAFVSMVGQAEWMLATYEPGFFLIGA